MAGRVRKFVFISLVMVTVNLVLFIVFPHYVIRKTSVTADTGSIEGFHAFRVLDLKALQPEKKRIEPEDKSKTEKCEKKAAPQKVDMQEQPVKQRPKELELDSLNLEMNFRLNSGAKVSAPPAPSAPSEPEKRAVQTFGGQFRMSEVDTPPVATEKVQPVYPYRAKRMDIGGKVKVRFLVTRDGTVSQVKIISAPPGEIFNQSVIRAVSSWRFKPGKIDGRKVETWMVTTIVFNINSI
ncbi:MAG: energy transducer TonB [Desulfobacteraceae bacterium]